MSKIFQILKENGIKTNFRISLAIIIALIISRYVQIGKDYWLILTIAIIYSAPMQGLMIRKSQDRVIGTTLGIGVAFVFCNLFLHYDYRWMYLILGFFLSIFFFMPKNYMIATFFITLSVISFSAINSPPQLSLVQLLSDRLFYTFLGIVLVILCEMLIFPKESNKVGQQVDKSIYELCQLYPVLFENILDHYIQGQVLPEKLILKIQEVKQTYNGLEERYFSQYYELRYSKNDNKRYQDFFQFYNKISIITSQLLAITTHVSSRIRSKPLEKVIVEIINILKKGFLVISDTEKKDIFSCSCEVTQVKSQLPDGYHNLELTLVLGCCEQLANQLDILIESQNIGENNKIIISNAIS